ncbi:hypothetical protein [Mitsuaria sp. GD03876]|uniref:hypothetical protein n=1 Tax=Mitsuaria sp. GD03876 TaxID=2975399 RepID=UPI002448C56B|nr:hypothetical protein [Mitsuaria sp. GD03876]MDH0862953.1 hypothetical protein [Mitsuaria sp. GD03876]
MTWAIVSSVVLTSAWLANSVQDKHERGGFRLPLAQQGAASAAPGAVPAHLAQTRVQVASIKR